MAAFEHMMTLVSFVLALAIAHLLISVVELVRAGDRVRHFWVHASWMAYGFLMAIAWWIGLWDLHVIPRWTTWSVLFNVLAVTTSYLFVAFVCPKVPEAGTLDLEAFHNANRRRYLGVAFVGSVLSGATALIYGWLYNVPGQDIEIVGVGVGLVTLLIAYVFANVWVQRIMVVVTLASLIFFFAVGDPVLT